MGHRKELEKLNLDDNRGLEKVNSHLVYLVDF